MLPAALRPASLWAALSLLLACGGDEPTRPAPPTMRLEALTPREFHATVQTEVTPPPRVRVRDRDRRPLANTRVTFTALEGTITGDPVVLTDDDGVAAAPAWVLAATAGPQQLRVQAGNATVVFTALADAGLPASLVAVGATHHFGAVASMIRSALRVQVTDEFGNPIREVPVTFSVAEGGGSVERTRAETEADGIATSGLWTLGPTPGIQRVIAEIDKAQVVFTAEACTDCPQLLFSRHYIYLFDLVTGEERQLTLEQGRSPAWSPDGDRIAFVGSTPLPHAQGGDIYIMDADGSNVIRRTTGMSFHSPTWSPHGDSLAVAGDFNGCDTGASTCAIYVLKVASDEEPRRIIAGQNPAWSPDGAEIAYTSTDGLGVVSSDGTRIARWLAHPENGGLYNPNWSPNGSQIAFSQCSPSLTGCAVFTVAANGVTQLTRAVRHFDEDGELIFSSFDPKWSPDGRLIAFTLWGDVVYIYATGGAPALLIHNAHAPAWRP